MPSASAMRATSGRWGSNLTDNTASMVRRSMPQTPMHDNHNARLLALIPPSSRRVIEVGCSTGAMAREWRRQHPESDWHGVEIDPVRAELARRHCQQVEVMDIEQADDAFFARHSTRDCWVFGDVLEHLRDPWRVLQRIRAGMSEDACVVACIPNVQHWSLQAALSRGEFRYVDAGLLDRTHQRCPGVSVPAAGNAGISRRNKPPLRFIRRPAVPLRTAAWRWAESRRLRRVRHSPDRPEW